MKVKRLRNAALAAVAVCTAVLPNFNGAIAETSPAQASSENPAAVETAAYSASPTYSDRYWINDILFETDNGLPFNYRTMEDEFGSYEKMSPPHDQKDEADSSAEAETELPSREGMDTLRISGSAQYSADNFKTMLEDIRKRTDGEICVFDLRQETHGFVNGIPASLYAEDNAGNTGLNPDEVLSLEKEQLCALTGTELTLKNNKPQLNDEEPGEDTVVDVDEVMTEQELCESQNVRYVRLSCTDRVCPDDEAVNDFMAAYLALPEGAWLHFHCAAGGGRTGLFMMMADMIRNPNVSMDDIISRQALLGASDPRHSTKENEVKKADLLQRFYRYVQEEESAGFPDTFTEWNRAGKAQ